MRLFHLVEQHDLIGPAPHCLGQHAAFFIADITRRRSDQPRDRMFFHIFRHVDADHGARIVEQEIGQRLGQFGFADPGGAQKQKAAKRTARVLQPGTRAAHGGGHGMDSHRLADHLC